MDALGSKHTDLAEHGMRASGTSYQPWAEPVAEARPFASQRLSLFLEQIGRSVQPRPSTTFIFLLIAALAVGLAALFAWSLGNRHPMPQYDPGTAAGAAPHSSANP